MERLSHRIGGRLRQQNLDLRNFEQKGDEDNKNFSGKDFERDNECGICTKACTKMVLPDCGHSMCGSCFGDWNTRSQSCPFCRGSLKRVSPRDLWVLTGKNEVIDIIALAKENLRGFYCYIESLPLMGPNTHLFLYDYTI